LANSIFGAELKNLADNAKQLKTEYERKLDDAIIEAAIDGEAYMKEHAPWNDSTGNREDRVPGEAREGLFTVPDIEGTHKEIVFSHSVDYGIWLETKHNGKDEIIMPSVKAVGEELMKESEGSLNAGFKSGIVGAIGELKGEQAIIRAHERDL
jgi:hypothetical protein